jgi:hypothetical protein
MKTSHSIAIIVGSALLACCATPAWSNQSIKDFHVTNWTGQVAQDIHIEFDKTVTGARNIDPFTKMEIDGKTLNFSGGSTLSGTNFTPRIYGYDLGKKSVTKVYWTGGDGQQIGDAMTRGKDKQFDKYVKGFTCSEWFDFSSLSAVTFFMEGSAFDLEYGLTDLRIYEMPQSAWSDFATQADPSLGTLKYSAPGITTVGQNATWSANLGVFAADSYALAMIGNLAVTDLANGETINYETPQIYAENPIPEPSAIALVAVGLLLVRGFRMHRETQG